MKILDLIPENELKDAVLSEYKKRLVLHRLTDERLKKKYNMSYSEFEKKNVVKEKGLSWEVEKDAMEWEHAIEGIRYLQEKITKIEKSDNED